MVFSSELNFLRDLEEVGVTLIFDEWCCVAYILGSFVMMFQVNFFFALKRNDFLRKIVKSIFFS